jgi:hypothetical protein
LLGSKLNCAPTFGNARVSEPGARKQDRRHLRMASLACYPGLAVHVITRKCVTGEGQSITHQLGGRLAQGQGYGPDATAHAERSRPTARGPLSPPAYPHRRLASQNGQRRLLAPSDRIRPCRGLGCGCGDAAKVRGVAATDSVAAFASGLYSLKQYWYAVAPYGADIDRR